MKAQEMFKELGYEQMITPAMLAYKKNDKIIGFLFKSKNEDEYIIVGNLEEEEEQTLGLMSIKEHKAITQQMIELGWL